jgi:hypothetical protein
MTDANDQYECGIRGKKGRCRVPLEFLEKLPVYHRKTIPAEYLDLMGHMNIR